MHFFNGIVDRLELPARVVTCELQECLVHLERDGIAQRHMFMVRVDKIERRAVASDFLFRPVLWSSAILNQRLDPGGGSRDAFNLVRGCGALYSSDMHQSLKCFGL